jgi:uncharacterized Fe-S center protein
MKSTVYFATARVNNEKKNLVKQTANLFDRVGGEKIIKKEDLVGIKLSFSEVGNTSFLRPVYIRPIVDKVKRCGAKPFLTDTNTLYAGGRSNSVDHINTAIANGFSHDVAGVPVIIADGLRGKGFSTVEINLKNFSEARIGSEIFNADAIISAAHIHGHECTGMAGTFKNIGMGLASRAGKQAIHCQDEAPQVNPSKCIGCGECIEWCPVKAISLKDKKAFVNARLCIRCGECTATCRHKAIAIIWHDASGNIQERIVEYAYAVLKNKKDKAIFYNFLLDISPGCLCMRHSDAPIVPDIGILASTDPVALEEASLNLVNQQRGIKDSKLTKNFAKGEDKFRDMYPKLDSKRTMKYAEEIGLGTRSYKLIRI